VQRSWPEEEEGLVQPDLEIGFVGLEILLLGGFRLSWQGRVVDSLKPGKAQLLLSYLLLHRDRPLPRARVAMALWPDSSDEQARTNLRRELHSLRRSIPWAEELFQVDARQLVWNPQVDCHLDIEEFENCREPEKAVALYAGELLPGAYEEWLLEHRDRLARRFREMVEQLLARQESQLRWREAIESARRLIALDPAEEESHRRLIRIYLALQDQAGARRAFQECQKRLREELDVEPSTATSSLLVTPTPTQAAVPSTLPPLLGREPELAQMRQWDGRTLLLFVGEPGIGKTRLLREVEASFNGLLLRGKGFEAESSRPFGPWAEAFRGYPEAISLLRSDGVHRARDLLFDPIVEWLRRQGSLQIVLDDLQWFDETSLGLVHYSLRLLSGSGVRFAASVRAGELESNPALSQLLRSLRRTGLLYEIHPQPLHTRELQQLVRWAAPHEQAEAVALRCGGNPLLALELAQSQQQRIEACIEERLERLSSVAREVVSWAAVIGRGFGADLLERSLGRGLFELLPALEELESHGILVPAPEGYFFRHDVLREITYEQLSGPRRRLLHSHIARLLEEHPPSWAEVARHACLAEDPARATQACLQAARCSLQVLAFQETQRFVREGLRQASQLPVSTQVLHWRAELLRLECVAGVSLERSRAIDQELNCLLADPYCDAALETLVYETLSGLAYDMQQDGQVEEYSIRLAARAQHRPAAEALRWLAHSGNCLLSIGRDIVRAEALLGEARELAERLQLQSVDLSLGWGLLEHYRGNWDLARQNLEMALSLARSSREQWLRAQCLGSLGRFLLEREDYASVQTVANELEEVASRLGEGADGPFAQALKALASHHQRATVDGEGEVLRVMQLLLRLDARRIHAFVSRRAALEALRRGRYPSAQRLAQSALESALVVEHPSETARARAVLVEATFLLGQPELAQEELRLLRKESTHPMGQSRVCRAAQEDLQRLIRRWGSLRKEERHAIDRARKPL